VSFLARDTVAGLALGLFAGSWLATGLALMSAPPGSTSPALGVFSISVAACFLLLVAGAAFGKAGPAVVIVVGAARFLLAGLYEINGSVGIEHAAAIVGFVLAGVALYTALVTELEDVRGRIVLPLLRRGMARGRCRGAAGGAGRADRARGGDPPAALAPSSHRHPIRDRRIIHLYGR
jgi:uncharacterized protein